MRNVVISVDAGKYMLKALGKISRDKKEEVKKVSFLSKMHVTRDITEECEGNSHKVIFDDEIYIIGDAGKKHDYDSDKEKILHKLCAYTAITEFIEPETTQNKIYMVLACPVDFIKNKELKQNYKEFIKGNGEISIKVDGNEYNFEIEDVTVKSEGSGVIYNAYEKYEDKEIALIDLGGVNFSFCKYNNCVVDKDSRFARNFGGMELNKITRDSLREIRKGKEVTRLQTEKALKDGYLEILDTELEGSKEAIFEAKQRYLTDVILDEIKSAGIDIESIKPIFSGGTSEIIREVIETKGLITELSHAEVVKDAQWNAVQGLFVIANNKYSNISYVAATE